MASNVQPLGRQVLLEAMEKSQESGLIIIPETIKRPERLDYFIRALGPQAKEAYPYLEPGQRIVVKKFHEVHITHEGTEYILTKVDNIEGVLE